MALKQLSKARCFSGYLLKYSHQSSVTKTEMKFNLYLPDTAQKAPLPALYWLSGLTCSEDNFAHKATIAFKQAAEDGIAIVLPDTSPRGCNIEGEDADWDFGSAASFYVNASTSAYRHHYQMFDYITKELPALIEAELPIDATRKSIFGHSMGGHGALMLFLRNPSLYRSVSAFAPICNPVACPWGVKAFTGYLGADNTATWLEHDSTELVKNYKNSSSSSSTASAATPTHILIDQGTTDSFYIAKQLLPENFVAAASSNSSNVTVELRLQPDYGHDYYFITTFITDHIKFHAKFLNAQQQQ